MPKVRKLRREIHANPEQGYGETATTSRIKQFLEEYGVPFCNFGHMTGGYAWIDCGKEHTAGFRADIDAPPIEEKNEIDFKSVNPGVMHACGHDMHASVAAGLAVILWKFRRAAQGKYSDCLPAGGGMQPNGGAKAVIGQGLFEQFGVEEFYGLHMWPELKVGEIAVKPGPIMASSDKPLIRVTGKESPCGRTTERVDAISIAAEIINAVEHKIRREISPFETVLISIGSIRTSGRYNIICDQVLIEGTIRSMNPDIRQFVHKRIKELAGNIAAAYRGTTGVTIEDGYAVVDNNRRITEKFINAAGRILGAESVHTDISPSLIGEDFSFYSQNCRRCIFSWAVKVNIPCITKKFLPKESTLDEAITLMAGYFTEFV